MPDVAALQLLVPAAEVLLDAVRGLPGVSLLEPAHVSLGYPWRGAADADPALVASVAASRAPFSLGFREVRRFAPDPRGRVLVHVVPDDDAPVRALAAALGADLRETHLSVARVLADGDVEQVVAQVEPLLPLVAQVEVLELTVQVDGRWQPGLRVPLGQLPPGQPVGSRR